LLLGNRVTGYFPDSTVADTVKSNRPYLPKDEAQKRPTAILRKAGSRQNYTITGSVTGTFTDTLAYSPTDVNRFKGKIQNFP
jgi:hypothetical protein